MLRSLQTFDQDFDRGEEGGVQGQDLRRLDELFIGWDARLLIGALREQSEGGENGAVKDHHQGMTNTQSECTNGLRK